MYNVKGSKGFEPLLISLCHFEVFVFHRAFGVALRGVDQSKTPAYFGLACGVFTPIRSAIQSAIQNSGLFWIWSADCTPKVSVCQMPWYSMTDIIRPFQPHRSAI